MNKKMSFKFNRTKPASNTNGRNILCMQRVKQPTARNHAKHKLKKSMEEAADGIQLLDRVRFVITPKL